MPKSKIILGILLLYCTVILSQNTAPTALNDSYSFGFNFGRTVPANQGVIANDVDLESSTLLVNPNAISLPNFGTIDLFMDGSFTYTPNTNYLGLDSFTYQVCDDGTPNNTVSRFDFDTPVLTDATIGPNAISINPNTAQTGCGIHFATGAGGSAGLDIEVPNTGGIFNFTSFSTSFEYQDLEGTADILTAGNFRIFHIGRDSMGISITVINGTTGLQETFTQTLGNFLSGNNPYTVSYDQLTGSVSYTANGTTTVFPMAPAFSPLDSGLASNIVIGRFMDGSGSALPSLCSLELVDTSNLCATAVVNLNVQVSLITNRRITYRVRPN